MDTVLQQAEAVLKSGDPKQALDLLTQAVKSKAADAKLRVFLAQLLCITGQWNRAHTQLNVMAEMNSTTIPMREMVGHAVRLEVVRDAVVNGKKPPMIFGMPDEFIAILIESLLMEGRNDLVARDTLFTKAMDQFTPCTGIINEDHPFEWLMDGDSRFGACFEVFINGRYYWVPFAHLSKIEFHPPEDLRDLIWANADLHFTNGGQAIGMVPVRYPGSEKSQDGLIQLARKTDWTEAAPNYWRGLGQRVLVTEDADFDLLSIKSIEFNHVATFSDSEA